MPVSPEFEVTLARLRDPDLPVVMGGLYQLSDLKPDDAAALEAAWPDLPPDRRLAIIQDLSELGEANYEVTFEAVFRIGLDDIAGPVRAAAIRGLWEAEDPKLVPQLLDFLRGDPDADVRAAAASALGRYVYLGEIEELPAALLARVEAALLAVIGDVDELEVRRRALEAVAYSSRPEVRRLIAAAYDDDEPRMRVSALFAMGRTGDARWAETVTHELSSADSEVRFEAARAAGELELSDAARTLAELCNDDDPEVRNAAIWSLGQVGGPVARETLSALLDEAEADDERDYIQEALDNLEFSDELQDFALFDFDADLDEDDEAELDEDDDEAGND